ncbi:high mobility group box domain-containing protein [Pelagophyceae sp. CCMP2097]|nr:high mobility group box domain-containing protein [Pelagophyceae sp. CCMP2097]
MFARLLRPASAAAWARPAARALSTEVPPKRAVNSYFLFNAVNRKALKEANPEDNSTAIMTKLGALWKDLPVDQRKKFEDEAVANKVKYEVDMKAWLAAGNIMPPKTLSKKKRDTLKALQAQDDHKEAKKVATAEKKEAAAAKKVAVAEKKAVKAAKDLAKADEPPKAPKAPKAPEV